jgi:hypothetical protein
MNIKIELLMIKKEINKILKIVNKIIVDIEKLEKLKSAVEVFDFNKKWHLVEPHLNSPHIIDLFDDGMERFCMQHKWRNLPDWDRKNGIGPWVYSRLDAHSEEIMNKMNEDPECEILDKKYYNIGKKMGMDFDNPVEFTDFLYTSKDPKIIALRDSYQKESNNIERKHSPKPNTYKWYQCFGACFFLAAWQEALAKKVFPNLKWQTIQNHKSLPANSRYGGHSTSIGIGPKGKIIIFDILLFENTTLDGILNAAGVDLPSLCENY